jgi:hypothetical protein
MRFVFTYRSNLLFGIRNVRHLGQLLSVFVRGSPLLAGAARGQGRFCTHTTSSTYEAT